MFEDESGKETIGIRAKISTSNKKTIQQDLNKIDTALYYSGYNMAIAYGELPSDGELDECVGTILALPIKRGIPEVPNLSQEVVDIVSLQQVHN